MSFIFDIAAGKAANEAGKYNQSVQERNATIAEQEAQQVEKQLEFDLVQFDKEYIKLVGQSNVAISKSGAELSGSALRIARYNAEQAELQKNVMEYNAKVAEGKKLEEATFARISGQQARMEGKIAQLGYYAKAGQSLLALSGGASGGAGGADQGLVVAP